MNHRSGKPGAPRALITRRLQAALLLTTALSASAAPAGAAEWINPGTGNWFDPANWDTSAVPSSSDGVVFGNGGTGQITNGDDAISNFGVIGPLSGGAGAVEVTGPGSSWTLYGSLYVGDYTNGMLDVSDGAALNTGNSDTYIGANWGSTGIATLTGAGSSWDTDWLYVGYQGTGTFKIGDGAALSSNTAGIGYYSTGLVQVDGAGTTWTNDDELVLGYKGTGTLEITNGAAVETTSTFLGTDVSGKGFVTVDGAGSSLTNSWALLVGYGGEGTLKISDGGTVSSQYTTLGNYVGSTGLVTVDGAGSSLTTTASLVVGQLTSGKLNITNGGQVTSGEAYIGSIGVGGDGTVIVDGAGSTWTNYDHMYLGTVAEGTLTISNGAKVDNDDDLDIGVGGTLNIGAAADQAAVAAGTIDADQIIFQGSTAALVFNHTDAEYEFDLGMSGDGTIRQLGPGTTVLTGNSSLFTGQTLVDAGTLIVDGSLGGQIHVAGTLGGNGTVGDVDIASGGTISPGRSVGTLGVLGDLTMASDSTYRADIEAGSSDLIQVAGTAYLNGADLTLVRTGGKLSTGYTILSADNGIDGTFGSLTSDYLFVTPSLDYSDPNLVTLDFTRNAVAFTDVAATPNQASAAAAAESLGPGGAIYDTILSLDESQAQQAFDALSGEGHATIEAVLADNAGLVSDSLLQRLATVRGSIDTSGAASGYAATPALEGASANNSLWGQIYGGVGNREGDGNAASAEYGTFGLIAGLETNVSDWTIGLAGQMGTTDVSIADRGTEGTSTDIGLGFYAGTNWGDTGFSFAGSLAHHSLSTTRDVVFPGFSETLTADYGALTGQVVAELDHEFDFGALGLIPYAQLGHTSHATDGFTEQGGDAALSSEADVINQSFATLGLRGEYQFVVGEGGLATLSGGIGWRRGFGEPPTTLNAFIGGSPFATTAAPAADDALLLESGLNLDLSTGLDLTLAYSGEASATGQAHALKAGLGGEF